MIALLTSIRLTSNLWPSPVKHSVPSVYYWHPSLAFLPVTHSFLISCRARAPMIHWAGGLGIWASCSSCCSTRPQLTASRWWCERQRAWPDWAACPERQVSLLCPSCDSLTPPAEQEPGPGASLLLFLISGPTICLSYSYSAITALQYTFMSFWSKNWLQ